LHIVPALADFAAAHPKVTADLALGYWNDGFMESGFDVQISGSALKGSKRLAYKHLTHMEHRICATAQYLEKHGRPASPVDLPNFNCITNSRGLGGDWPFTWNGRKIRAEVSGNLRFDNMEAIRYAVLASMGIARLPYYLVASDLKAKKLLSVFPQCDDGRKGAVFATSSYAMKIYYDGGKLKDLKVSAFVDFLARRFDQAYDWQAAA
jgi:DNA-binding transcriptional LysR family regulator